jgi:hypothetical protein
MVQRHAMVELDLPTAKRPKKPGEFVHGTVLV